MPDYKFSVIIPACNEQKNITELMEKLNIMNSSNQNVAEVIVINDGSNDSTGELLESFKNRFKWLKIHHHHRRMGITAALESGHQLSSTDIYMFFPADLQFDVSDIPRLAQPILDNKYDIVTGKKIGVYNKKFISTIYNRISKILFSVPVTDLNSIKAYRKKVLSGIPLRKDWHRYMVVLAYERGARVGEIDVKLYPRKAGKSKFGLFRIPIGLLDLFSVFSEIHIMRKPMMLFGSIGSISMFAGILTGFIALILRILGYGFRPLLYLVILLVLGGFSSFTLGIIGETIAGISKRQETIIKEIEKLKNNKL